MNAETKRFLKIFVGVPFAIWLVLALLFGPGDFSCAYRREHKNDHDRYLQIIKSEAYKLHGQRPELHAPGMEHVPVSLAADIAFVEEYTAREEFRKEKFRSSSYTTFFQFFNAALVVWLAWRLGKAPLLKYLDDQIHDLREKIAAVRNAREAAAERKRAAQAKLEHIAEDEKQIALQIEERVEREKGALDDMQQLRISIMSREMEDRKQAETLAAVMAMKAELVNRAVDGLLSAYADNADDALRNALVDKFTADLERQPS